MNGLIKYGLAAAMVFATAMPAMARVAGASDICAGTTDLATQDDLTKAGASFTVAANIFPKGNDSHGWGKTVLRYYHSRQDRHLLCQCESPGL